MAKSTNGPSSTLYIHSPQSFSLFLWSSATLLSPDPTKENHHSPSNSRRSVERGYPSPFFLLDDPTPHLPGQLLCRLDEQKHHPFAFQPRRNSPEFAETELATTTDIVYSNIAQGRYTSITMLLETLEPAGFVENKNVETCSEEFRHRDVIQDYHWLREVYIRFTLRYTLTTHLNAVLTLDVPFTRQDVSVDTFPTDPGVTEYAEASFHLAPISLNLKPYIRRLPLNMTFLQQPHSIHRQKGLRDCTTFPRNETKDPPPNASRI
ncbi:hypothetical protein C8J56DRAFT_1057917 [Mycena floridula]|nr:hypothetical protein C8J56DRAFT_1057917 [Mycena floridula]